MAANHPASGRRDIGANIFRLALHILDAPFHNVTD
ncbi:hypothetical protein DK66_1376 [Brucella suis 1330]|nr:hypothetical protein DK66_1376 [Brucella suis 1330]